MLLGRKVTSDRMEFDVLLQQTEYVSCNLDGDIDFLVIETWGCRNSRHLKIFMRFQL